jgi:hypothetical protein
VAVAELVEGLLGAAPGLRVLATSRDPLRIAGETVWRVPSLEVPEPGASVAESRGCAAVELFVDRALAVRPGLRLDEGAISAVAELTRRLDGMPLAIELAASRVAVLDLGSILEGLGHRFAILAGGSRTAPARHQSLRAAVACARYARAGGELAAQVGDSAAAALAAAAVAVVNGLAGRPNEAEGERALHLARQAGGPLLLCEGLFALAVSTDFRGANAARCRATLEELLATAEESGDTGFSLVAHGNLCLFGEPKEARPHVERSIELEAELGSSVAGNRLGELLYEEGDYRGSFVLSRRAFERARRQDVPWYMADAVVMAASCVIALGSDDVAAARLYGFAQRELEKAGFGDRYRGYPQLDADLGALKARLSTRLTAVLAEGAAMTREQVSELLAWDLAPRSPRSGSRR